MRKTLKFTRFCFVFFFSQREKIQQDTFKKLLEMDLIKAGVFLESL